MNPQLTADGQQLPPARIDPNGLPLPGTTQIDVNGMPVVPLPNTNGQPLSPSAQLELNQINQAARIQTQAIQAGAAQQASLAVDAPALIEAAGTASTVPARADAIRYQPITSSVFDQQDKIDYHPVQSSFDAQDKIDYHPVP